MVRLKPRFSLAQVDLFLAQRDTFSALVVWSLLEGLSFLVLPHFQLFSADGKQLAWLLFSAPLGVAGAVFLGLSSSVIKYAYQHLQKHSLLRQMTMGFAQLAGLLGLAGVGFPMIFITMEFWLRVRQNIS